MKLSTLLIVTAVSIAGYQLFVNNKNIDKSSDSYEISTNEFTIVFPSKPLQTLDKSTQNGVDIKYERYSYSTNKVGYSLNIVNINNGNFASTMADLEKQLLKKSGNKLVTSKHIRNNGKSGKLIIIEDKNGGIMTMQAFDTGTTSYKATVHKSKTYDNDAAEKVFFESFTIKS